MNIGFQMKLYEVLGAFYPNAIVKVNCLGMLSGCNVLKVSYSLKFDTSIEGRAYLTTSDRST